MIPEKSGISIESFGIDIANVNESNGKPKVILT